jgi:hypothetical protein
MRQQQRRFFMMSDGPASLEYKQSVQLMTPFTL